MNPRLVKEFRLLAFPAGLAALAALALPLKPIAVILHKEFGIGDSPTFFSWLTQWIPFVFILGFSLLAAMPFGAEFQHRTLSLLLGQPEPRSRLWREKMVLMAVLSICVLILLVFTDYGSRFLSGADPGPWSEADWLARQRILNASSILEITLYALAAAGIICSSCWWTLVSRSTIGGAVFNFTAMCLIGGVTSFAVEKILGPEFDDKGNLLVPHRQPIIILTFTTVGIAYSALGLWLGWRKFSRMELRDALAGEGLALPEKFPGAYWLSLPFRCRPTGGFRNLIRKEIRLHRGLFFIAAIFTAGWLLTLVMLKIQPEQWKTYRNVLDVLTVAYLPLMALLTGCISLAEEKSLGLAAWHLTLPIPSRRQWLLKLSMATGLFLLLGLILPGWLAALTPLPNQTQVGVLSVVPSGGFGKLSWVAVVLFVVFGMSFWSASFSSNAVRSIVTAISSFIALVLLVMLASWCANQFEGLQTFLLSSITALTQSEPGFFYAVGFNLIGSSIVLLAVVFVGLKQSLTQFRRAQSQGRDLKRNALVLAGVVFAGTFWCADLAKSCSPRVFALSGGLPLREYNYPLVLDVSEAVKAAMQTKSLARGERLLISPQELEQTRKLSWPAKVWLRNSGVTVFASGAESTYPEKSGQTYIYISGVIGLPRNPGVNFGYWKLKNETKP